MMRHNQPSQSVYTIAWGFLAVGLLILGRWEPARLLSNSPMIDYFWHLKVVVLCAFIIMTALPASTSQRDRVIAALVPFIVLILFIGSSYFWVPAPTLYSDRKIADLFYNSALVITIAVGLQRRQLRSTFWLALISSLGFFALLGLITMPTSMANDAQGRLAVLGGGPNIFGRNMGILLAICTYFAVRYAGFRLPLIALAGAASIGLIASGSRGALLATLIAMAILLLFDPQCRRFAATHPLLVMALSFVGAGVLLVSDLSAVIEVGTTRFLDQTIETQYTSGRDILLTWAWHFWLEAPLFGNGLGSFVLITPLEYPHNIVMEFLAETGVVGFALFIIFYGFGFFGVSWSGGEEKILVLSLIAMLTIAAMISGDFIDARILFLFLLYPINRFEIQLDPKFVQSTSIVAARRRH